MNDSPPKRLRKTCIVCGESKYDYLFRPDRSPGPVVRCKNCGFVFVNPIEIMEAIIEDGAELFDRSTQLLQSSNLADIEGSWEQSLISGHLSERPAKELNAKDTLSQLEDVTSKRGRLLDFGCFCGVFLNVASQMGWDCYGIEPLVMPAIYARGNFNLRVVTDTLREDTYPSEFFDAVTSFQVFEHLVFPEQEIEKIRQILKPDGLLVIEVPNIDTITVKILGARHRHFTQDHVSFFSGETLGLLLNRMGFQVRKCFYPSRTMSLQHLFWWMNKELRMPGNFRNQRYSQSLDNKFIRLNVGDIVTVIAQKVPS